MRTKAELRVKTFVNLTIDSFGSTPSSQSPGRIEIEYGEEFNCDVTARRMTSSLNSLKLSGETTRAGRRFANVRSVKGN